MMMIRPVTATFGHTLNVPPLFRTVVLREVGDAFGHAVAQAPKLGAGALVHVGRYDVAEFAVVLEPEEKLSFARRAFYAGALALRDALSSHVPAQKEISLQWPGSIRVDGAVVGTAELAWPDHVGEEDIPPWLVFGATIQMKSLRSLEPGLRPDESSLEEEGADSSDAGALVEGFSRYFMSSLHFYADAGWDGLKARTLHLLKAETDMDLDIAGNMLVGGTVPRDGTDLKDVLMASPGWARNIPRFHRDG